MLGLKLDEPRQKIDNDILVVFIKNARIQYGLYFNGSNHRASLDRQWLVES